MSIGGKRRLAKLAGLVAFVALVAATLTMVRPDWLEAIFGLDPDAGDGSVERAITIGAFLVAAVLGSSSVLALRRLTVDPQATTRGL